MTTPPTIAILLARGGSKGVPRKNIRPIGGLSLVARSVLVARNARSVDAIYVSTDDQAIAAEAKLYGGNVINRPAELSGDMASSESGWLHALGIVRKSFPDVGRLVLLQCTSPFTTGSDIDGCLMAMEQQNAACSLSVLENYSFLWEFDENGFGKGINHDEEVQRQRRQDLRPSFAESGAIYCVDVRAFEEVGRRFCGSVALYPVDHPAVEIDTFADLALCEAIAKQGAGRTGRTPDICKIKAVVTDFDGVHTDDKASIDENGLESVTISRSDGMGVELLRKSGRYKFLILSKERNQVVSRRAEKLRAECLQAQDDKIAALGDWLAEQSLAWEEVLFVGNDINDVPAMKKVGVSACPCDSHASALAAADWIVPVAGGDGVIRAVADQLVAQVTSPDNAG